MITYVNRRGGDLASVLPERPVQWVLSTLKVYTAAAAAGALAFLAVAALTAGMRQEDSAAPRVAPEQESLEPSSFDDPDAGSDTPVMVRLDRSRASDLTGLLRISTLDSETLRGSRRATKVIGSTVYDERDESIGQVRDILIPPGGRSPVAVISVGGFLGIDSKLVAVSYDQMQMRTAGQDVHWTLPGVTRDALAKQPTFNHGNTGGGRP